MKKATTILMFAAVAALSGCAATNDLASKLTTKEQVPSDRKEVKGMGGWTGYVQGTAAPKSKFSQLQIGMSEKEVTDILGMPNDQSGGTTAKSLIPLLNVSGSIQHTYYYKGQGRVVLANKNGSYANYYLVAVENDATERGYKQ